MAVSTFRVVAGRVYRYIRTALVSRLRRPGVFPTIRKPPSLTLPKLAKFRPPSSYYSSRVFGRFRLVTRPSQLTNLRAAMLSPWLRGIIGRRGATIGVSSGISLITLSDPGVENTFDRIRSYFMNEANFVDFTRYPRSLNGYEFGNHIAKGCNAVVYEAKLKTPTFSGAFSSTAAVVKKISELSGPKKSDLTLFDSQKRYPLAIKMMFNYDTVSNEDMILREMGGELVPCTDTSIQKFLKWHTAMKKKHENIMKILTAFVDDVPILPGAAQLYPAALPAIAHEEGAGRSRTLFLIMHRYTMTLREYLLLKEVPVKTGQILFGQLLEALNYLFECKISHRDLKSDNILVDFDEDDEPPSLVVADFGCCMSRGTMVMHYPHPDVDLGGNLSLRAPEIARKECGYNVYLDFSKADLWAGGTLGLEIFTKVNPFYRRPPHGLLNTTYEEGELPSLSNSVPHCVSRLIGNILKINPKERPSTLNAANVLALSLFGINYLPQLLKQMGFRLEFAGKKWSEFRMNLAEAIALYAAETVLGRSSMNSSRKIGRAESALRSAFLSRADPTYLIDCVPYFY